MSAAVSDLQKFFQCKQTLLERFPPYIELHYQSFKSLWKRPTEELSRAGYLGWLLAYDHESPILNYAKSDSQIIDALLTPYIDENGSEWSLTKLQVYFARDRAQDFISWNKPAIAFEHQDYYKTWFLFSPQFHRYFPTQIHNEFTHPLLTPSPYSLNTSGIDIIGFPTQALGLGEFTRSLIDMANELNIPVNIVSNSPQVTSLDSSYDKYQNLISSQPKHKIRIFNMPLHNIPATLYKYGLDLFRGSHNILCTAWEFDQRINDLDDAFLLFNEVWTLSDFVKPAFKNHYNVSVQTQSCALAPLKMMPKNRNYFSLPENSFLFLSSFDFNSFTKRKNPEMAIDAFIKAFGADPNVGLVIKCSNSNHESSDWKLLTSKIENNKNIFLIDATLSRADFIQLLCSTDAFVSLHRSEGFGYILAESMLLNKPVICTAYSGNMDYCTKNNAYLVDYTLVPVLPGEYPQSEGLMWAEPKIDSAVEQMKKVLEDTELRKQKVDAAYKNISANYTTKALSIQFQNNLKNTCSLIQLPFSSLIRSSI